MSLIHRAPIAEPPPHIDRPVHREQCPEGHSYIGPLETNKIREIWQLAHAKHWEGVDDA